MLTGASGEIERADSLTKDSVQECAHPPRSDVHLVDEDSTAGEPSEGGGECEEGDGEDVVAADEAHSHQETCDWQHTCAERTAGVSMWRENVTDISYCFILKR